MSGRMSNGETKYRSPRGIMSFSRNGTRRSSINLITSRSILINPSKRKVAIALCLC